ncbi:regulator of Vps4 activity in the MVB pathway-domain-containing protein [Zopfochytrium polystomum]|nr:regulator of Vps4 activity in the MVB pathway-domain-containing protein [Zopfochytrium polystomum]
MSGSFNPQKCKIQLKLAISRLKLLQQKKTATNQAVRREIAQLLEKGKVESAKVRTENIIREDFTVEALEILELYCEILVARFGLLEQLRHCDQSISEAVNTLIYAAPRCEVKELTQIQLQLIAKFGKEFGTAALANENDVVNSRRPTRCSSTKYLVTIAKAYNVPYDSEFAALGPNGDLIDDLLAPPPPLNPAAAANSSALIDLAALAAAPAPFVAPAGAAAAAAPPPQPPQPPLDPARLAPDDAPSVAPSTATDFDELTRRFEALKKRK